MMRLALSSFLLCSVQIAIFLGVLGFKMEKLECVHFESLDDGK
jgi:hypothetical protein